ncbi:MAG TPA: hypothetical protein VFK05_29905 [Polyangiaceae bacterium]|nr:hypothetical protein [Polyangiaceae bacterium]
MSYRSVSAIGHLSKALLASDCIVLYPDGFPVRPAQRLAMDLINCPTVSLVIIVTTQTKYQELNRARTLSNRLIVLSPPAWPWTLFATIQSSLPSLHRETSRLC